MLIKKYLITIESIAALTLISCANNPSRTTEQANKPTVTSSTATESKSVTNTVAKEPDAYNSVEISFKQNSATLDDSAKTSLNSVIEQARKDGKINEIMVLSWSDKEYPSSNLKKLPKPQRELAEKRNKSVENYLKSVIDVNVDTYNMAKQPNTLSKWFNTEDNKLKKSLLSAGLATTAESANQMTGKASRSVILIKVK